MPSVSRAVKVFATANQSFAAEGQHGRVLFPRQFLPVAFCLLNRLRWGNLVPFLVKV